MGPGQARVQLQRDVRPAAGVPGLVSVDAWVTDDAPFEVDGPMGKGTRVMRNPPPPTVSEGGAAAIETAGVVMGIKG